MLSHLRYFLALELERRLMETSLGGISVLRQLVAIELVPPIINSLTPRKQACVWLLQLVPSLVIVPVATRSECLKTAIETAQVWLLPLVHPQMLHQITLLVECFRAGYSSSWIYPGAGKCLMCY